MPTTPHPEDPAEGSRDTVDRDLNRAEPGEEGGQPAEAPRERQSGSQPAGAGSARTSRTQERIQADIDAGKQGDKTRGFDPAAVPMEADAEAGGFPTEAREEGVAIEHPERQNAASTGNAMRPIEERGDED